MFQKHFRSALKFFLLKLFRRLENIGCLSLNIMCTHYFILRPVSAATLKLFNYDVWHCENLFKAIVMCLFILFAELGFVKLLKKMNIPNTYIFKVSDVN